MSDDVAALQEKFAIERDADRSSRALCAGGRCRPTFDAANSGDLAGRHDLAGIEDKGGDDGLAGLEGQTEGAVVEFL